MKEEITPNGFLVFPLKVNFSSMETNQGRSDICHDGESHASVRNTIFRLFKSTRSVGFIWAI